MFLWLHRIYRFLQFFLLFFTNLCMCVCVCRKLSHSFALSLFCLVNKNRWIKIYLVNMVPIEIGINYHHTLINCCSHCFFVSFSLVDFISFSFDHLSSYLLVFSVLFGAFFPSLSQSMLFVFSVALFLYHSIHEPSSQQLTSNFFFPELLFVFFFTHILFSFFLSLSLAFNRLLYAEALHRFLSYFRYDVV